MAAPDTKTEQKKVSRIKVKKKLWYTLFAPKIFGEKEMGETYLSSPETALNRNVKINLKDLTGNIKDQNAYAYFKINKIKGTQLQTTLNGYELSPSYVKRLVRKNCDRIDDYYEVKTKNNDLVVIKTLSLTIKKTPRGLQAKIRKLLGESLAEEASKSDFETFVSSIIYNKIQMALRKKLSKIYPLREMAVRVLILKKEGHAPEHPTPEAEAPTPVPVVETLPEQPAEN